MIETIKINNKLTIEKLKSLNIKFNQSKYCSIKLNINIKDRALLQRVLNSLRKNSHVSFAIIDFFIENGYKFSTREIIQLLKFNDAELHNNIYLSIQRNIYIQLVLKRSPYICHYIKEYG